MIACKQNVPVEILTLATIKIPEKINLFAKVMLYDLLANS